jgi:tRNA/rRNA methyltransferase
MSASTELKAESAERADTLARVRVVLVETSHPGNVGSAARAMKTMGLHDLVIVAPRLAAPHEDAQAIALASGATDVLATTRIVPTLADALNDIHFAVGFTARKRELTHAHVSLREAAGMAITELETSSDVRAALGTQTSARVALVFGNEAMCLSNDDVDRCQLLASVPANPVYSSLNLAQTVQVACYEMMMAANAFAVAPDAPRKLATAGDIEALMQHLERAAIAAQFLDPQSPKRFSTRMRRLFTRARMEPEEVAILRGLLAAFENSAKDR